jgi:iron complex transport system permease protein
MTDQTHWLILRTPRGKFSLRLDRRVPPVLVTLSAIALIAFALSLSYGEYPISPLDVLKTLLGIETENTDIAFIVTTLRLPRTLTAFLVGVGLAVSGTILQCLTRNPLAAPGIIGVNAGASLAAVALIVWLPNAPLFALPVGAFVGAIAITLPLYALARSRYHSPLHLILVGIGLSAIASAITTLAITLGEIHNVSQALVWMSGSVYGRSWSHVWSLLPWLVVLVPLAFFGGRNLNALNLSEDVSRGLGVAIERQRSGLWLMSAALAAASVATAGTVAFVGFVAPHLARQFVGASHEGLIPTAALTGGTLVVVADLIGRSLFAPTQLPCGIVTGILGAPYFLYLLYKVNRS